MTTNTQKFILTFQLNNYTKTNHKKLY